MKKVILELNLIKIVFILLFGVIFFSSCKSVSINSQTKSKISPTPETQNKMKKSIKFLKDFKWKNRIILVKENEDKALSQLQDAKDEINERDVIWFRSNDGKIETNYQGELPKDFVEQLENDYFEEFESNVLLIGKDGTVKSKDDKLNLKNYFSQIDSMPMRRQEMKRN